MPRVWSLTARTSSAATLIAAYRRGIFPWPYDARMLLWWSPDPRAVLPLDGLHVARRLARTLRQGRFRVTLNAAFPDVIDGCAARAETWITPAIREAYVRLHDLGWAHSVEVWVDAALAGGLYGLAIGGLFAAESMFHRVSDASKVAVVALVEHARRVGTTLIDVADADRAPGLAGRHRHLAGGLPAPAGRRAAPARGLRLM